MIGMMDDKPLLESWKHDVHEVLYAERNMAPRAPRSEGIQNAYTVL